MIQVYHNPRCGKSRSCLAFLEETGAAFEIIQYLHDVPTFEMLQSVIKKLGLTPIGLIRQNEKIWIENYKGKTLSDAEIINAMVEHPILIERPIVINGDKAVIARPTHKVSEVL